ELLQIMSHDIANRISVVDMSLDYVLTKGMLHDSDKAIIQKAKKNSQQLCDILRSTQKLELAHIKGIDLEAVDIGEVFNSIENFFKIQMTSKNINLICLNHIPPYLKLMAEKSSLEMSVLSNLISNAIKFSPNGTSITMEATVSKDKAIISITDQGRGMLSEERENLFKKKHRTSTLGTNGEQGTGFGLGIVNKYVQMYNANISVEPNFPTGTKFIITLDLFHPQYLGTTSSLSDANVGTSTLQN
ncbi:MAG: sensor histidine kinase, partial [Alphaproteobacteria bacterium]